MMVYFSTLLPNPSGGGNSKQVRDVSGSPPALYQQVLIHLSHHFSEGDDSIYLAPEETLKDAPPSYASAQADAVPPYWETTTIHLPSGVSASSIPGEMIIEGLPTGTLFSFMWNMLVSISFQFVGFLLTFLLHTTHAAKFGSRAGLGVTLIQFGFAMRTRLEDVSGGGYDGTDGNGSGGYSGWRLTHPTAPDFKTAAEADEYYKSHPHTTRQDNYGNGTDPGMPSNGAYTGPFVDSTSEWVSFFLMTVGEWLSSVFTQRATEERAYRVVYSPNISLVLLEGQEMGT
jgi:hypothetical protein